MDGTEIRKEKDTSSETEMIGSSKDAKVPRQVLIWKLRFVNQKLKKSLRIITN